MPVEDTSVNDRSCKSVVERRGKEPNVVLTAEQFQQLLQTVGKKPEDEEDVSRLGFPTDFQPFHVEDKNWVGCSKCIG